MDGHLRVDSELTRQFKEGMLDPRVVISQHISHDKVILEVELAREEVVVGELWGNRWNVEGLQDIIVALSISDVANGLDGVTRKGVGWELGIFEYLVEDLLSDGVGLGKFVVKLTVVRPDVHGAVSVEVINELDEVLMLDKKIPHSPGLWLRERLVTCETVAADAFIVAPEIAIVSINVDSLLPLITVFSLGELKLSIVILSLHK